MSRHRLPSALFLASLAAVTLAGCGEDVMQGATPTPPDPDGSPRLQGAAPDSPVAELSADTLLAPPPLALVVEAVPGALRLHWDTPPPATTRLRLFEHEAATGRESVVPLELASDAIGARLPLAVHRVRWHDVSWRLERCDADGCLTSLRVPAPENVLGTIHDLTPPVAVTAERFGESVALNANGVLLVVAAPVEGRVVLVFIIGDTLTFATPLPRLHDASSTTRALAVSASASGDTLAVLSGDAAAGDTPSVSVLERLGESWIETERFDAFPSPPAEDPVPTSAASSASASADIGRGRARPHIALSADGSRLIASCTGDTACAVALHEREPAGWRQTATLSAVAGETIGAVAATAALDRIAVLGARADRAPELRIHDAERGWRAAPAHPLPLASDGAPLALAFDAEGTRLAIGGLEASAAASPDAVLWRYRLHADDAEVTLHVEDSLRLPAPAGRPVALALAGDGALDTLAFGWHTANGEAALATYVRVNDAWRSTISLPGDAPTLARRAFGSALAFDADGGTLALGAPALPDLDAPSGTTPDTGRVLLMNAAGEATEIGPREPLASAHGEAIAR